MLLKVHGNTAEVNAAWGNAIGIIWQDRGSSRESTGNQVYENDVTFLGSRTAASTPRSRRAAGAAR